MRDDGAERLVMAIIVFAVSDLITAQKNIRKGHADRAVYGNSVTPTMQHMHDECVRFFHSAWFSSMCDLDGDYVIEAAKERSKEEFRWIDSLRVAPEKW